MKRSALIFLIIPFFGCNSEESPEEIISNAMDETGVEFISTNSDSLAGQIQVADELRNLMNQESYEKAIDLFSKEQRIKIKDLQKDDKKFQNWIYAWTFDDAKYQRYMNKINEGRGSFVLEDGTWKIDEQ